MKKDKRGQVWIETVLYTLLGITLIGLTLGFVMPKINESRDRALVEQAITSMADFDSKVSTAIQTGEGNAREANLLMKKGEFYVSSTSDEITLVLRDMTKPYSEPGIEISVGRVKVKTESAEGKNDVYLTASYTANITFDGSDSDKKFNAASTPYSFLAENKGPVNGRTWIDITQISNR